MQLTLLIAYIATALTLVQSHGVIFKPLAQFKAGTYPDSPFSYDKRGPDIFPNAGFAFNSGPEKNVEVFKREFAKKYSSLRDMCVQLKTGDECGNSDITVSPKTLPSDGKILFHDVDGRVGFFPDHKGPCELWCDETRVFSNEDCASNITEVPAVLSIDTSKCKGSKLLKFVWIAVHNPEFQIYKNCIPLADASNDNNMNRTTTMPTTQQPNSTSIPATMAPSSTKQPTYTTMPATLAPSTTSPDNKTKKPKCRAKKTY